MKLYTEEQMKDAFIRGVLKGMAGSALSTYELFEMYISEITPIELPSDDEIARVGLDFSVGYKVEYWNGFKHCGEWMKQQILNQNK